MQEKKDKKKKQKKKKLKENKKRFKVNKFFYIVLQISFTYFNFFNINIKYFKNT